MGRPIASHTKRAVKRRDKNQPSGAGPAAVSASPAAPPVKVPPVTSPARAASPSPAATAASPAAAAAPVVFHDPAVQAASPVTKNGLGRPRTSTLKSSETRQRRYRENKDVVLLQKLPIGAPGAEDAMIKITEHKAGAAAFPVIAKLRQDAVENLEYKNNVINANKTVHDYLKPAVAFLTGANISVKQFAQDIDQQPSFISNVRSRFKKRPKKKTRLLIAGQYKDKRQLEQTTDDPLLPLVSRVQKTKYRVRRDPVEISIATRYWDCNTSHHSGDHNKPAKMSMSLQEFDACRVAKFPQMCREENIQSGNRLFEQCKKAKNSFQKSVLAAIHAGEADGFLGAVHEFTTRKAKIDCEYHESLHSKKSRGRLKDKNRKKVGRPRKTPTPALHDMDVYLATAAAEGRCYGTSAPAAACPAASASSPSSSTAAPAAACPAASASSPSSSTAAPAAAACPAASASSPSSSTAAPAAACPAASASSSSTAAPTKRSKRSKRSKRFDPSTYYPKPMGFNTYFDLMKRLGKKYTHKIHETICPLCESGPAVRCLYVNAVADKARIMSELQEIKGLISSMAVQLGELGIKREAADQQSGPCGETLLLRTKLAELRQQGYDLELEQIETGARAEELRIRVRLLDIHDEQLAKCRPYLKYLEETLLPGWCIVYRDFVNSYDEEQKVSNLVFVVLWRENAGEPLRIKKIHNICASEEMNSCDSFYVEAAFQFHLKSKSDGGSGFFERFHTMIICGDHGSHFSSAQTIWQEAMWSIMYNKKVYLIFLCSYHAFNRCDGAGNYAVQLAEEARKEKKGPKLTRDHCRLLNEGKDKESKGTPMTWIARPELPVTFKGSQKKGAEKNVVLRKKCQVEFIKGETTVVRARNTPNEGPWEFLELVEIPDRERLCYACSNADNEMVVRHWGKDCPVEARLCARMDSDDEAMTRGPVPPEFDRYCY